MPSDNKHLCQPNNKLKFKNWIYLAYYDAVTKYKALDEDKVGGNICNSLANPWFMRRKVKKIHF